MITIDRLVKIDRIAMRIMAAIYRGLEWAGDQYEARLADAAYKAVETKAAAIAKAEDKISDLEDARSELLAYGAAAEVRKCGRVGLAALAALDKAMEAKGDKLDADLAAAAESLVAADKAYTATIRAAKEKLDIEVDA